jgi:hypothetical protein
MYHGEQHAIKDTSRTKQERILSDFYKFIGPQPIPVKMINNVSMAILITTDSKVRTFSFRICASSWRWVNVNDASVYGYNQNNFTMLIVPQE